MTFEVVRGRPRYGWRKEEIGHPSAAAMAAATEGSIFMGMKVLFSKLMCRPENSEKAEKDDKSVIGVLQSGAGEVRGERVSQLTPA